MPRLEIELLGHLLVGGGRAEGLGIDAATARHRRTADGREGVPVIPATALRGAVRMQLEALSSGAGLPVAGPYLPADGEPDPADDIVARLFGRSGPLGKRTGALHGCLRFSDGVPEDPVAAAGSLRVRPGVAIDSRCATAADGKLFFLEVVDGGTEPLRFTADLGVGEATAEDLQRLRAAVESTAAIGAGKARGGGAVRIRWSDDAKPPAAGAARVEGSPERATRARLTLRLLEPAHFGEGDPYGNYVATRRHVPGATVRGALAWALLRAGKACPEDPAFGALFLTAERARFGDGLAVAEADENPRVRPITTRTLRAGGGRHLDRLVPELARERVNAALADAGSPLFLRDPAGDGKLDPLSARPDPGLFVSSRTRVSIDRRTGTAAEGKLFTVEQVEPWGESVASGRAFPVTFVAWVEGLTPESAKLLAQVEGLEVLLGGRRNHGLGKVNIAVRFELEPKRAIAEAVARVECLASALEERAADYAQRANVPLPPASTLPLALIATADFVPTEEAEHPLMAVVSEAGRPRRAFLEAATVGGYDQRPGGARGAAGGPLKELLPAVAAGSVYVYEIARESLSSALERALPAVRRGVGGAVELGCGRFALFEAPEEGEEARDMSVELPADLKRELVAKAEVIAGKAVRRGLDERKVRGGSVPPKSGAGKKKGPSGERQVAQLRNLLQITQREAEVPVLANFIRYQAARRATKDFWKPIYQDVIDVLSDLEERKLSPDPRLAIQSFLGYLIRAYVFEAEAGDMPSKDGAA